MAQNVRILLGSFCVLFLTACGQSAAQTTVVPADVRPTRTPPPTATAVIIASATATTEVVDDLFVHEGPYFSTSGSCARCHTELKDDAGRDVSIDTTWRGTMMANAARDPYWQASVAREVLANPEMITEIESLCARCHTPMAAYIADQTSREIVLLQDGFLNPGDSLHGYAMDGVSCTVCHQITDQELGFLSSYSGDFVIDPDLSQGSRTVYGPYSIAQAQRTVMISVSGFDPQQGLHTQRAEMCATCHTLYTPIVDQTGDVIGLFPQQTPYFEWFYSSYRRTQTCQSCHMPDVEGGVRISNMDGPLRTPFGEHVFVGGNTYGLALLDANRSDLGVLASEQDIRRTYDHVIAQLSEDTARLTIEKAERVDTWLQLDLLIENLAGHKIPTGFPSRRIWIHVLAVDAQGTVVFESGLITTAGSITGNDNDLDPGTFEPHYDRITRSDEVQIYEPILGNTQGQVTTVLLHADEYLKDNRLLPQGFDKEYVHADIAVYGRANVDDDFIDGSDQIRYVFQIDPQSLPLTITAELLYQPVAYTWIEQMRAWEAHEIDDLLAYAAKVPNQALLLSSAEMILSGE